MLVHCEFRARCVVAAVLAIAIVLEIAVGVTYPAVGKGSSNNNSTGAETAAETAFQQQLSVDFPLENNARQRAHTHHHGSWRKTRAKWRQSLHRRRIAWYRHQPTSIAVRFG